MKAKGMGRIELLAWINEFTESDYAKIEVLSDGIAYCQVLDAIHPGVVNLNKLKFDSKFPEDYQRNLKVLDDALKKLRIEAIVSIDKLSRGKFQDNMVFTQWLYNYVSSMGFTISKGYKGYEKRLEAINKLGRSKGALMNAHLVPNKAYLKLKNISEMRQDQQYIESEYENEEKDFWQMEELSKSLENDLRIQMETNWKILHSIEEIKLERDFYFNLLKEIETKMQNFQDQENQEAFYNILTYVPDDFKVAGDNNTNKIQ